MCVELGRNRSPLTVCRLPPALYPLPRYRSHASAADDPDARELVSPAQHRDDPPQSANQIVTVEGHQ